METPQAEKTSPKDIFLHLLSIITLYMSAGSFIALLFQYVNVFFPDPIAGDAYGRFSHAYSVIRWSLSSLIVVFPVFLVTSKFLEKSYAVTPLKRNLRIRKWLIYFTLFAAALIIIGDVIVLLNNFLGGELTLRFLLKVLVILFVSNAVFWYYLQDVRKHKVE